MEFNINVIQTEVINKGKYNQLEVTYKDLNQNKVASKKLMSFVKPEKVYKSLVDSKAGDQFTVTTEKNSASGYWDWIDIHQAAPGEQLTQQVKSVGNPTPKSNYETAEERAKKQVFIVKQSSLSNAVAVLSVGAKNPPSKKDIFDLAQEFTDWVFQEKQLTLAEMPDDFPDVE